MTILSQLLGTPLQPDREGHVLMLEEVTEAMYRIDRSLFHITSNAQIRKVAGMMLGRCHQLFLLLARSRVLHARDMSSGEVWRMSR